MIRDFESVFLLCRWWWVTRHHHLTPKTVSFVPLTICLEFSTTFSRVFTFEESTSWKKRLVADYNTMLPISAHLRMPSTSLYCIVSYWQIYTVALQHSPLINRLWSHYITWTMDVKLNVFCI